MQGLGSPTLGGYSGNKSKLMKLSDILQPMNYQLVGAHFYLFLGPLAEISLLQGSQDYLGLG